MLSLESFITLNFVNFNPLYLFYLAAIIFISYCFTISLWNNKSLLNNVLSPYKGDQRVHMGETSRWGGSIIYLIFIGFYFFIDKNFFLNYKFLFLIILPFMILSFIEDTFSNISILIRLFFMLSTALLISIFWIESYPVIENIPLLSALLEFKGFSFLFFSLALIGLMNGANFIDGMNGLASLTFLGAMCSCIYLSYVLNDSQAFLAIVPFLISILVFLIFNYPYGKIFLGDSGAYLFALLLGTWLIAFFANHDSISAWNAILILFYPIAEVLYSATRKLYQSKSPFRPDRQHLHIKVFDMMLLATNKPLFANSATTVFLAIFWIGPPLVIPFVYASQIAIIFSIFFFILVYLVLNIVIPYKPDNCGKTT